MFFVRQDPPGTDEVLGHVGYALLDFSFIPLTKLSELGHLETFRYRGLFRELTPSLDAHDLIVQPEGKGILHMHCLLSYLKNTFLHKIPH